MTTEQETIERLLLDVMVAPDQAKAGCLSQLSDGEWAALIDLAQEHRCATYLAYAASSQPAVNLPERLRILRARGVRRAMRIGRECVTIHAALAQAGIRHLFLKGIPLSLRDYPEPWTRPMRDIDVLIEPGKETEAYHVLLAAGGPMAAYSTTLAVATEEGKHFPPIHSPNRVMPVEIHYRMISPAVALPRQALQLLEDEAWRAPELVRVGPALLPVPAAEVLLAHLVIHGLLDHELNNGPLFLTDILHLLRSNHLDQARWHSLVDRLAIHKAVSLTASLLPATERTALIGGESPSAGLTEETVRLLMFQPAGQRARLKLQATLADTAPPGRVALLTAKLFPGRETLRRRWLADGRSADRMPSTIALWLWYLADRTQQHLAPRTTREARRLAGLRDLRRTLADRSGGHEPPLGQSQDPVGVDQSIGAVGHEHD